MVILSLTCEVFLAKKNLTAGYGSREVYANSQLWIVSSRILGQSVLIMVQFESTCASSQCFSDVMNDSS